MIGKFKFFAHKVLPTVFDDSLSYYEVLTKLSKKVNEVIDSQNNIEDDFETLDEHVEELSETVDGFDGRLDECESDIYSLNVSLGGKLNKATEGEPSLYGHSDEEQFTMPFNTFAEGYTIVQRTSDGTVKAADGEEEDDCATVGQLNGKQDVPEYVEDSDYTVGSVDENGDSYNLPVNRNAEPGTVVVRDENGSVRSETLDPDDPLTIPDDNQVLTFENYRDNILPKFGKRVELYNAVPSAWGSLYQPKNIGQSSEGYDYFEVTVGSGTSNFNATFPVYRTRGGAKITGGGFDDQGGGGITVYMFGGEISGNNWTVYGCSRFNSYLETFPGNASDWTKSTVYPCKIVGVKIGG